MIENLNGVEQTNGTAEPLAPEAPGANVRRLNLQVLAGQIDQLQRDLTAARLKAPRGKDAPVLKVWLAIVAGCVTPALALAMSTLTGTVAGLDGKTAWLAALPLGVLLCMLIVSTPHIAEAKRELGWERWQAWAFAVGLDAAIVVAELLSVWCHQGLAEIWWLPRLVIFGAVVYSATLNSYVNLLHAGWSKVVDPREKAGQHPGNAGDCRCHKS